MLSTHDHGIRETITGTSAEPLILLSSVLALASSRQAVATTSLGACRGSLLSCVCGRTMRTRGALLGDGVGVGPFVRPIVYRR